MRIKIKTVMDQMNAEKPDEVLAELEAKYAHDERDEPKRKRYISCKDRMCGASDCPMTRTYQEERELCKRDVCMFCGGRAIGYNRVPDGPNEAGNWTHQYTTTMRTKDRVLCLASSIFARELFEENPP